MDIKRKLQLIREGYSLPEINTPLVNESLVSDVFLESIVTDINLITETSIDYITENDTQNFKQRARKIIDWIKQKLSQFLQFIKSKFGKKKEQVQEIIKETDKVVEAKDQDFHILVKGYERTFGHAPIARENLFGYLVNVQSYTNIIIREKSNGKLTDEKAKEIKEQYVKLANVDFDDASSNPKEFLSKWLGKSDTEFKITKDYYKVLKENLSTNINHINDIATRYIQELQSELGKYSGRITDDTKPEDVQFVTKTVNHSMTVIRLLIQILETENSDIERILGNLRSSKNN